MCCQIPQSWQWRLCNHVRWMSGSVSCWLRTNSKYVCNDSHLNSKLSFVFDTVRDSYLTFMRCLNALHYNPNDGCIYVHQMYTPVMRWFWTKRQYVYLYWRVVGSEVAIQFHSVRRRNLTLTCCPNTWKCWWRFCVYIRWMYKTMSCCPWMIRPYVYIGVRLNPKVLCVFDVTSDGNLTSPWCGNTLHTIVTSASRFMFVEYTDRCHVHWSIRSYVCFSACLLRSK